VVENTIGIVGGKGVGIGNDGWRCDGNGAGRGKANVLPGKIGIVELIEPVGGARENDNGAIGFQGIERAATGGRQRRGQRREILKRPIAIAARQYVQDVMACGPFVINDIRRPNAPRH
jgi:hypothetical protein